MRTLIQYYNLINNYTKSLNNNYIYVGNTDRLFCTEDGTSIDIRKFTEYVFKNMKDSKGKNKIFYDLGFDINDSGYLQNEYCKQALNQYLLGNYVLKNLIKEDKG